MTVLSVNKSFRDIVKSRDRDCQSYKYTNWTARNWRHGQTWHPDPVPAQIYSCPGLPSTVPVPLAKSHDVPWYVAQNTTLVSCKPMQPCIASITNYKSCIHVPWEYLGHPRTVDVSFVFTLPAMLQPLCANLFSATVLPLRHLHHRCYWLYLGGRSPRGIR